MHTISTPSTPWVSQAGIAWALDQAQCKPTLRLTLLVIARAADAQGRGSRQSVATIAAKVGKSTRQIKRDISALVADGLLLPGDASAVAHLPAAHRPAVWDLAMGANRPPKPVDNSSTEVTPTTPVGCHPCHGRGDTHDTQISSEKEEEKSLSLGIPNLTRDAAPLKDEREKIQKEDKQEQQPSLPLPELTLARHGVPTQDRPRLIAHLTKTHKIGSEGWWITASRNGTLAQRLQEAADALKPSRPRHDTHPALSGRPQCSHGLPGGAEIRPETGTPACPLCRAAKPRLIAA